jgi:anaerobic selenocysteine-containing dehydrogenase
MKFDTPSGKIELFSSEANEKWGISPLPEYTAINHPQQEDKYPLILLTPNTGSRIHSQFGNLKIIRETNPEPYVRISPVDAQSRGLIEGQKIRVFNQKGELLSRVSISNRVLPGLAVFPNGIWFKEGGGVNQLISEEETDIGYGAAFHDNRIEIEGID